MKIAAIISEYNPFHNGHAFHVQQTRERFGATHVVAIMSGSFVQRGDVACIDKFTRTKMALLGGVDLVLELPVPWAMASAETFSRGGVGIAAGLGCVDILSFGSECGDVDTLRKAAALTNDISCKDSFRKAQDGGLSYASSWAKAVNDCAPECAYLFSSPNDTLGIEYCKALSLYAPDISPRTVKRIGASHDSVTSSRNRDYPVSASYIRELLRHFYKGDDVVDELRMHLPEPSYKLIYDSLATQRAPADISLLDRAIICNVRRLSIKDIAQLPDVSEGLENRISKAAAVISGSDAGFLRLCDMIKCKRYSHARLRRILLSALLGIHKEDSVGIPPYIRVLGLNQRGKEVLSLAKERFGQSSLPIISKPSQINLLSGRAKRVFALETMATDLWSLALPNVAPSGSDFTSKLIVV